MLCALILRPVEFGVSQRLTLSVEDRGIKSPCPEVVWLVQ